MDENGRTPDSGTRAPRPEGRPVGWRAGLPPQVHAPVTEEPAAVSPDQGEPRFKTHDVGLAAFIWEFKDCRLMGVETRPERSMFVFDLGVREGEYFRIEYMNSDFKKFERKRKDLVDLAHGEKKPMQGSPRRHSR